jgi:sarcosine oxidase subunit gamma
MRLASDVIQVTQIGSSVRVTFGRKLASVGTTANRQHSVAKFRTIGGIACAQRNARPKQAFTRPVILLARGCPLDLHPRVLARGQCVQSHYFKASIVLVPLGSDSYEIVVRRSFADYFCRILLDAGCNVTLHKSPICGSQIGAPARIRCERAILWALPPKRSTPGGTPWNTAS